MNTTIKSRRFVMLLLVGTTILFAIGLMTKLLSVSGWGLGDTIMIVLFALITPWVALGFWNSIVGLILVHSSRNWLSRVAPYTQAISKDLDNTHRTALVMPIYNENTEQVFRRLRAIARSLDDTDRAHSFDIFVLSDTNDPKTAVKEVGEIAAWRSRYAHPHRLHYRRRLENNGGKAGNVWEFCQRHGDSYDYMVVLNANSIMSGRALLRLVQLMQANPQIGILQTLAVGLPTTSPFGRIMQFVMRQGMRAYTVGSAWWQGPAGPYWGHNAIVRLAPFKAHYQISAPLALMTSSTTVGQLMHRLQICTTPEELCPPLEVSAVTRDFIQPQPR